MFLLGIVLFILGIALSVALHEAGHLLIAKACGMKVRRYFIGFGPTLWKKHVKGTDYGLKALPLGGFCDIAGMTLLDDELTPEEEAHAMYKKPAWQRVAVMLGGIAMNILLGLLLMYVIAVGWGLPRMDSPTVPTVAATSCVAESEENGAICRGAGPAADAGILAGDVIVGVNGQSVDSTQQVVTFTQRSSGTVTYDIQRNGEKKTVSVTPVLAQRQIEGATRTVAVTGVSLQDVPIEPMRHYNALQAVPAAASFSWDINKQIVHALAKIPAQMPSLVKSIFGGQRSAESPVSIVGASVAGGDALKLGSWPVFFMLLAQINFVLALFNVIPLPPLDGGHVMVIFYEKIRDAVRRLMGKEPIGPADYSRLLPLTSIVIGLMLVLFIVTVVADVVNPIRLVQ